MQHKKHFAEIPQTFMLINLHHLKTYVLQNKLQRMCF